MLLYDYKPHEKHDKGLFQRAKKDYRLTFIEEKEFLGTGGGLSLLKGQIHTPLF